MNAPSNLQGLRFKALRNSRNYTNTEFAKLLSITPGYVTRIERSHVPVSKYIRDRCVRILGVPEDYFDTLPKDIELIKKLIDSAGVENIYLVIDILAQRN